MPVNRYRGRATRYTRRDFLRTTGLALGGLAVGPSLLAACGGDDDTQSTGTGTGPVPTGGGDPTKLVISNWPLYIDPGRNGTVRRFEDATGIDLTYTEDIDDNNTFFAEIQPVLAQGNVLPQDIVVPTYWLADRLRRLEWLDPLPLDDVPNAANLDPSLRNPPWDPDGTYSLPWQGGITGIAYNIDAAGRELRTMDDLLDPEFSGRIGMLKEMRDTVGLWMLATGVDPATATFDDAAEAFDIIEEAKNSGQIRRFTGNSYQRDLIAGDFVACIGWSGDIAQLQLDEPALRFAVPESGGMRWLDTMVMPKGAPNRDAAAKWMDFVYDVENAAKIAAYVGYISPVQGVREALAADPDPAVAALAEAELMFPDEEMNAQLHYFNLELSEEEEAEFDARFNEIIGG